MADPELSVVLVNHDGADVLPRALRALEAGTRARAELVVVDSGSSDGSWRAIPPARVVRFEDNVGFAAGCNAGARVARGRLVAFVNFDGEVEPDWDEPLRSLLADPGISIATGLLVRPGGEVLEAAGLEIAPNTATYGRLEGAPRSAAPAGPVDVPAASGALMMVRRDEFLALGGFYEPIWMYGEEADLAMRIPGRIVLHPASALVHEMGHAAGPPRSPLRLYWPSRNRIVNAARHLPPLALARSIAASAAFDLLTLAQVRRPTAARAVARGWRDGLARLLLERRARGRAARRGSAGRLTTMRAAVAQQRRLGRA